jgi:hypothetical protein
MIVWNGLALRLFHFGDIISSHQLAGCDVNTSINDRTVVFALVFSVAINAVLFANHDEFDA